MDNKKSFSFLIIGLLGQLCITDVSATRGDNVGVYDLRGGIMNSRADAASRSIVDRGDAGDRARVEGFRRTNFQGPVNNSGQREIRGTAIRTERSTVNRETFDRQGLDRLGTGRK